MSDEARVDAFIANARPFAQPILRHLRALVRAAHPEIGEAVKWSRPMFTYRGKIVASLGAFAGHASFATWQRDGTGIGTERSEGMGELGKLTTLADLPADEVIVARVRSALALVDEGGSLRVSKPPKPLPVTPDDLAAALDATPAAAERFAAFPPSCRREYIEWVTEAKTAPTRAKRIAETVAWTAEGKRRNWKYEAC